MLVGGTINGEYIDIVLPQSKVDAFLIVQIKKKYGVNTFSAKAMLKSKSMKDWENEFGKEIKSRFANYVDQEITKWRNYDNYIATHKRRKKNEL